MGRGGRLVGVCLWGVGWGWVFGGNGVSWGGGCPQLVCGCRVGDEISQMLLGGICSSGLGWFSWLAWRTGPVTVSLAAWSRVMRLQVAPTIHSASTHHPPPIHPRVWSVLVFVCLRLGSGLVFVCMRVGSELGPGGWTGLDRAGARLDRGGPGRAGRRHARQTINYWFKI